MKNMMEAPISQKIEKEKAKRLAWTTTIIYLSLLPFLLMIAFASVMVFDRPNTPLFFGLALIFLYFLMPLSILLAVYLVWSRFVQGNYKQSRRFCWIPCYVIGTVLSSFALMDAVENIFK
jgi:phosphoglycerol transferase MdoB-like AlkP superfamily enzyme